MKKYFLILLFTVLLLLNISFSSACVPPSSSRSGTYSGSDCGSDKFSNGDLDQMSNSDWDQLKANDLAGKLDQVPDLSKLNQRELSTAINNQYGTNHNFQNIPQGSNIKDGILTAGDNTINLKELKGSHNVDLRNGKFFVDGNEFDSANNLGGTSSNNINVGRASNIKTKNNLNFKDIKGGTFLFNQLGDLESAKFKSSNIQTKNNINLKDENGNNIVDFNIIDNNKESSIDIEKQNDGSYKITTSNLESTFHGNGFNEYVFGEKSVIA